MKGTIIHCLEEMVEKRFGRHIWEESLKVAGVKAPRLFLPFENIHDDLVTQIVKAVCTHTNLSLPELADAFGKYWVMNYSQRTYPQHYTRHKTAREFLLALDKLHTQMTRTIPDARPPHFAYEWKNENTLVMHYRSHRGLIDFAVGLAKGVGAFYREKLEVKKVNAEKFQIVFL